MGGLKTIISGPDKVKAPKMDIAGDIQKYVSGYQQSLPSILGAEKQFRPEFLGLNLGDVSSFLQGTQGQQGLYALGRTAQQETGQSIADARASEFASMTGQAPAFRQFAQALSPEAQAQVDAANFEAQRATQAARQLTPEEQRMSDQAQREGFASRGMLNSRGSVAGEVLGRAGMMAQKRQEADYARQGAFNMAQNFYTAPGLQALGNLPLSYQTGQQQLNLGLGAIGSALPQMINPDTGVNLGMQQRSQQVAAAGANAQAQAGYASGVFQGIGNAVGGALSAKSDIRLKENIRKVGMTNGGLPVYIYNYIGDNLTHMGVMAQDVEKVNPDAVTEVDGYKAVYYGMIE
jgi:hypothetical protein